VWMNARTTGSTAFYVPQSVHIEVS